MTSETASGPGDGREIVWCAGDALSAAELYELLSLRIDVFVVEQACAYHEADGRDLHATTHHGFIRDAAGIAAAVRLLADEEPARIGRVVTRADARGRGLAADLVRAAHTLADAAGTVLDAQTYLVDWYESLGWAVTGASFVEDGIDHTPMRRSGNRSGPEGQATI